MSEKMTIEKAKEYLTKDPHYLSTAINQVAAYGNLKCDCHISRFKKILETYHKEEMN